MGLSALADVENQKIGKFFPKYTAERTLSKGQDFAFSKIKHDKTREITQKASWLHGIYSGVKNLFDNWDSQPYFNTVNPNYSHGRSPLVNREQRFGN